MTELELRALDDQAARLAAGLCPRATRTQRLVDDVMRRSSRDASVLEPRRLASRPAGATRRLELALDDRNDPPALDTSPAAALDASRRTS